MVGVGGGGGGGGGYSVVGGLRRRRRRLQCRRRDCGDVTIILFGNNYVQIRSIFSGSHFVDC